MPVYENILVMLLLSDAQKNILEKASPKSHFTYLRKAALNGSVLAGFDAAVGNIPLDQLQYARNLKWLQLESSGVEGYCDKNALPKGCVLTSATGAFGPSVAEHAFAMTWSLLKNLHRYRDSQGKSCWEDHGPVGTLNGANVLVVGMGDIGGQYARMCAAMGAMVKGIARRRDEALNIYPLSELDALLPEADVVMICLPATDETNGLFGKTKLGLMKKTAILINVGRGSSLNTEALCDAVSAGNINGAGLDVTWPEPLPPEHRLWQIQNILLTPHVAGGLHLSGTLDRIVELAARNLRLIAEEKQPDSLVPPGHSLALKKNPAP